MREDAASVCALPFWSDRKQHHILQAIGCFQKSQGLLFTGP